MKVKNLIAKLAYCDPEATIVISEVVGGQLWYWEVTGIREDERHFKNKKTWKAETTNTVLIG